jgi:hypothetical protein
MMVGCNGLRSGALLCSLGFMLSVSTNELSLLNTGKEARWGFICTHHENSVLQVCAYHRHRSLLHHARLVSDEIISLLYHVSTSVRVDYKLYLIS